MKSIPKELEEAAAIDGCGMFRCMWQVNFPIGTLHKHNSSGTVFLWTWNDFLMPNLYVPDSGLRTLTVAIYMFKSTSGSEWNLMLAGMTLSMGSNHNHLYCSTEIYHQRTYRRCSKNVIEKENGRKWTILIYRELKAIQFSW